MPMSTRQSSRSRDYREKIDREERRWQEMKNLDDKNVINIKKEKATGL